VFDARLVTLLCKKKKKTVVAKYNEVKTRWSDLIYKSGSIFQRRLWLKKGCFVDDEDRGDPLR
jgi:hypothetical protein